MKIFNRNNANHTGKLATLTSWMLISPNNSTAQNLSIQISEIPVGSQQPIHNHAPEQCYYIIKGIGLMTIEEESRKVKPGDAVHIASNLNHGIKNIGDETLEYLTANAPVFSDQYEKSLWPISPARLSAKR